jgi:hypothetical protein
LLREISKEGRGVIDREIGATAGREAIGEIGEEEETEREAVAEEEAGTVKEEIVMEIAMEIVEEIEKVTTNHKKRKSMSIRQLAKPPQTSNNARRKSSNKRQVNC